MELPGLLATHIHRNLVDGSISSLPTASIVLLEVHYHSQTADNAVWMVPMRVMSFANPVSVVLIHLGGGTSGGQVDF